jgi:hypothetical protein
VEPANVHRSGQEDCCVPANAHRIVQQNCRVRQGGRGRERVGVTTSAGELGEFEVPGEATSIAMSGAYRTWQTLYQSKK